MNKNTTPMRRQMEPTVMYAMPRKGFRPPSSDVVEMITLLVPLNCFTRNPDKIVNYPQVPIMIKSAEIQWNLL